MGIDISGGIIVGAHGSDLDFSSLEDHVPADDVWWEDGDDVDYADLLWYFELERYAEYYEAGLDQSHIGFKVSDVSCTKLKSTDSEWMFDVLRKAKKFEELFGINAMLLGCQYVW